MKIKLLFMCAYEFICFAGKIFPIIGVAQRKDSVVDYEIKELFSYELNYVVSLTCATFLT